MEHIIYNVCFAPNCCLKEACCFHARATRYQTTNSVSIALMWRDRIDVYTISKIHILLKGYRWQFFLRVCLESVLGPSRSSWSRLGLVFRPRSPQSPKSFGPLGWRILLASGAMNRIARSYPVLLALSLCLFPCFWMRRRGLKMRGHPSHRALWRPGISSRL